MTLPSLEFARSAGARWPSTATFSQVDPEMVRRQDSGFPDKVKITTVFEMIGGTIIDTVCPSTVFFFQRSIHGASGQLPVPGKWCHDAGKDLGGTRNGGSCRWRFLDDRQTVLVAKMVWQLVGKELWR